MGQAVVNTAALMCSFGTTCVLVSVNPTVLISNMPASVMTDFSLDSIPTFGDCKSPTNPATKRPPPVLFTPAPCTPVIPLPWKPASPTVLIGNVPALNDSSQCECTLGAGMISITSPGQMSVQIP